MRPERSSWNEVGLERGYSILAGSDISKCQACQVYDGTQKHRLYHCSEWHEIRREIPEAFRKWEQMAKTSKKELKWQRGTVAHPFSESPWNRGNFRMKMLESEKHRSWELVAGPWCR